MRSVVVVFPASMCAMMPMFRMRSSGVMRGIAFLISAKMRGDRDAPISDQGPVSLRHHRGARAPSTQDPLNQGPELSVSGSSLPRGTAPGSAYPYHL